VGKDTCRGDAVVFVVDDDGPFRQSTVRLLGVLGYAVRDFESAEAFLVGGRPDLPACLLLDVCMPGLSGLDLQRLLSGTRGAMPVVFMTAHGDIPTSVRAMKEGAIEFLTKPFSDRDLVAAIDEALARDVAARAESAEQAEILRRYEGLTRRERDVLLRVVRGKPNKHVAVELGISEITVKTHRRKVMDKMGAESLPALVRMTDRLRLLDLRAT
jgi:FixJ family two-component response regulator